MNDISQSGLERELGLLLDHMNSSYVKAEIADPPFTIQYMRMVYFYSARSLIYRTEKIGY